MKTVKYTLIVVAVISLMMPIICYSGQEAGVVPDPESEILPNKDTSASIRGLRWLQQVQNKDGSWGDATDDLKVNTGVSLIAYLWHGETPISPEFGKTVEQGMKFLVVSMSATNSLAQKGESPAFGHAISTWALCEGFGMTRIMALKEVAEKGLADIVKGQKPSGLWDGRYGTEANGDDVDASVWQIIALKSGYMAGLDVEGYRGAIDRATNAFQKVIEGKPDIGRVAGAIYALQRCGGGRSPACKVAMNDLAKVKADWKSPGFDDPICRWFLMSQAMYGGGGEIWGQWYRMFYPRLLAHQIVLQNVRGEKIGYWDSPGSKERFGRIFVTALSVMMLEDDPAWRFPAFNTEPSTIKANDSDDVVIQIL